MKRERALLESVPAAISDASGRRLSNQIGRAFRGTFGAKIGLRMIMRSIAGEMLAAGATAEAVTRALETSVLHHPGRIAADSRPLMAGRANSTVLAEIACECVADVARKPRQ